jgi:putative acetyltransferase
MNDRVIAPDDPRNDDVRAVIARHLAFAHEHTPPENVYALDLSGLLDPAVTFYSCRALPDRVVVAIGALRMLEPTHAELKSMHTIAEARGEGIGRTMVDHLLAEARARGVARVSLETGTGAPFAAAVRLYASVGFRSCEPFAEYVNGPDNQCMTLLLGESAGPR